MLANARIAIARNPTTMAPSATQRTRRSAPRRSTVRATPANTIDDRATGGQECPWSKSRNPRREAMSIECHFRTARDDTPRMANQAEFRALVERHHALVFGAAVMRCRDRALAEDITQEAFLRAWLDRDALRDPARIGSWVAGIASNLAASELRRRLRRERLAIGVVDDGPV